jgi:hypothetical protein
VGSAASVLAARWRPETAAAGRTWAD